MGIAGRGFKVSVGERAVQEQCPLGTGREQVAVEHETSVCRAGQFQLLSVVMRSLA